MLKLAYITTKSHINMLLFKILKESLNSDVSDIILTAWSKPCFKINGDIVYRDNYEIYNNSSLIKDIWSIMNDKQKLSFKENKELDFSIELKWFSRFRANVFYTNNWIWIVFRPIKSELPDFKELGLPNKLLDLTNIKHWLILVTWSVWSWKSTTLTSLIDSINKNKSRHIITIEDPIEFIFKADKSLIEQREVWVNTLSFDNWLKYALRQASDVIMLWEMRDVETFRLALRAAETGNLVLATLHTSGAARTISRIIDMFPAEDKENIRWQLSDSLIWVIWQDLIKTKDWKGRVLASELLVNNTSISNMIRKGIVHQIGSSIETGAWDWMYTMESCLLNLKDKWLI